MFVVFGENDTEGMSVACGLNLSEAIMNWCSGDVSTELEAFEEFNRWSPTVVEGNIVKAEIKTEVKVTYNIQR